jgi:hypothetical protein
LFVLKLIIVVFGQSASHWQQVLVSHHRRKRSGTRAILAHACCRMTSTGNDIKSA